MAAREMQSVGGETHRNHTRIRWAAREGTTLVLVTGATVSAGGVWLVVSQALAHDYDWLRWIFVLGVGFSAFFFGARDRWNSRRLRLHGVDATARVVDRWMKDDRTFIAIDVGVGDGASAIYQGEVSLETWHASRPESHWRVRVLPSDPRVMELVRAV